MYTKKILIALAALVLAEAFVICAFQYRSSHTGIAQQPGQSQQGDLMPIAATTTVTGEFACLPHKGSGPSTMECAFGMKADSGEYYALDFGDSATSAFDLPMGKEYAVMGLFTPAAALSSDHWQVYDIKGVIKVASYNAFTEPSSPAMPFGNAMLELRTPVKFGDTVIRVMDVIGDSRCPSDVTCIQAGKVSVALSFDLASGGSSTAILQEGQTATADGISFTLDKVTPYPVSTHKTADSEYRFAFTVTNK